MSNRKLPSTPTQVGKGVMQFKIGMVTDLDKFAQEIDDEGHTVWKARLMTGTLTYDYSTKRASVEIGEPDSAFDIISSYSRGMRGMELSELIIFEGKLYTVCDKTGIVYDITNYKAVPWVILSDGDGKQDKGFKGEWMTRKGGLLYVGGHGREVFNNGEIESTNYQWVKKIDPTGAVEHVDWRENFNAMRTTLGMSPPGYITHEATVWSDVHQEWFFLPRKKSATEYDEEQDERSCTNILLRCSEDFKDIKFQTIGNVEPTRGYSSFKFIPNTDDTVIVAIKSEEIGNSQKSFITVFTIDGEIILEDMLLADVKYEGIEFI